MAGSSTKVCDKHSFSNVKVGELRTGLLDWYSSQKRELPWRTLASSEEDPNKRAYAVWVSEIMLQQTQVSTVIDYYTRWMARWPTVEKLAEATLEDVNHMWSGLGYYSRGKRLWEGARKVVAEMDGVIPQTCEELVKCLPGVGQYTAGAIASIAYGQHTGVVDGNVMRVFARHRLIGADITSRSTVHHFWDLANTAVDPLHPGDFNQALMELGATICTPKCPQCKHCPIKTSCGAYAKVQSLDSQAKLLGKVTSLETERETKQEIPDPTPVEDCPLCLPAWRQEFGVMNYPQKAKKKPPSLQYFAVAMIENKGQLLLRKRPNKGLLAGLWEFPSVELTNHESSDREIWEKISSSFLTDTHLITDSIPLGKVVHQFSHTHHHYQCWYVKLKDDPSCFHLSPSLGEAKWVRKEDIRQCAIPTAVKKMIKLLNTETGTPQTDLSNKRPNTGDAHSNQGGKPSKRQ